MEKDFTLNPKGIDEISGELQKWSRSVGISKENTVRIRLTIEELLLRVSQYYKDEMTVTLEMKRRLWVPIFHLSYTEEPFNPVMENFSGMDEEIKSMFIRLGFVPEWTYRQGRNELFIRGPRGTIHSEVWLIVSVLLAALSAILGNVIPIDLKSVLLNFFYAPVSNMFMNALTTFIGPMIFITVMSGVCSIGNVSDFNKIGKYVISRMLSLSILEEALCIILMIPFFRLGIGHMTEGKIEAVGIADLIFSIIPSNPVTPFAEKNLIQIMFMSLMVGAGMLVLGERTKKMQEIVHECDDLLMEVIDFVCKLLPLYIYTSLTVFFWQSDGIGSKLLRAWKPVLLVIVFNILLFGIKVLIVHVKLRVPVKVVVQKISKTMLMGFMTASSASVFADAMEVNENDLGIAPEFNNFANPFGLLLIVTQVGSCYVAIMLYFVEMYQIPVNVTWMIILLFMVCIFSLISPPVSGGMLVCIGMIMAQLKIPTDGIAVAGILALITDFIATGFKIGDTHLEILLEANALNKLDKSILRARPE